MIAALLEMLLGQDMSTFFRLEAPEQWKTMTKPVQNIINQSILSDLVYRSLCFVLVFGQCPILYVGYDQIHLAWNSRADLDVQDLIYRYVLALLKEIFYEYLRFYTFWFWDCGRRKILEFIGHSILCPWDLHDIPGLEFHGQSLDHAEVF